MGARIEGELSKGGAPLGGEAPGPGQVPLAALGGRGRGVLVVLVAVVHVHILFHMAPVYPWSGSTYSVI